ncbi:MAG TPA: hypothetical protein VHX36_13035 [Candidatus Acidoferrales bacterium]|jgi:hypothetical protein|nr:hypothetical protein [Candidatus Acidoferrales bacterium]
MTKKATREKTKTMAPVRTKKQTEKKKAKARWHEEAVIHQDLFFAEASMEP